MIEYQEDFDTAVETLQLITQIITYTFPQDWKFAERFPDKFREFRKAAGRLTHSKDKRIKACGRALKELDRSLSDIDRGFTPARAQRAADAGNRVVETMEVAMHGV
ncbi:hypothetical protein N6H13_07425 [Paenibacillus sp. CC-CFT742]|nr:hypothetical protein [Paenibacillus sp. CC-CFT742]WJH30466.1 hypothetical protein N6H13_07425 [Paenibacillus sp. CC-CFT742]